MKIFLSDSKTNEQREFLWQQHLKNRAVFTGKANIYAGLTTNYSGKRVQVGRNKDTICNFDNDRYTRIVVTCEVDGKKVRLKEMLHKLAAWKYLGRWSNANHVCQGRRWCGELGHVVWGTQKRNMEERYHKLTCPMQKTKNNKVIKFFYIIYYPEVGYYYMYDRQFILCF